MLADRWSSSYRLLMTELIAALVPDGKRLRHAASVAHPESTTFDSADRSARVLGSFWRSSWLPQPIVIVILAEAERWGWDWQAQWLDLGAHCHKGPSRTIPAVVANAFAASGTPGPTCSGNGRRAKSAGGDVPPPPPRAVAPRPCVTVGCHVVRQGCWSASKAAHAVERLLQWLAHY